jgi:hypothetical protein
LSTRRLSYVTEGRKPVRSVRRRERQQEQDRNREASRFRGRAFLGAAAVAHAGSGSANHRYEQPALPALLSVRRRNVKPSPANKDAFDTTTSRSLTRDSGNKATDHVPIGHVETKRGYEEPSDRDPARFLREFVVPALIRELCCPRGPGWPLLKRASSWQPDECLAPS